MHALECMHAKFRDWDGLGAQGRAAGCPCMHSCMHACVDSGVSVYVWGVCAGAARVRGLRDWA